MVEKKEVYINIDDITTSKDKSGKQIINIKDNANVYSNKNGYGSGFVRTGKTSKGGIKNITPPPTPTPTPTQTPTPTPTPTPTTQLTNAELYQATQSTANNFEDERILTRDKSYKPKINYSNYEAGVLTVRKSDVINTPTKPYLIVDDNLTNEDAGRMGNVLSQVTFYPPIGKSGKYTEKAQIENLKTIKGALSIPENTVVSSIEFEQLKNSIQINKEVSTEMKNRNKRDIIWSRFLDISVGANKIGIGTIDSALKLQEYQTVRLLDEKGKPLKSKSFGGSFAENIRKQPIGFGTSLGIGLVIPPLGGALVQSSTDVFKGTITKSSDKYSYIDVDITKLGQGIKETVYNFSPFKFRSGIYGALEGKNVNDITFKSLGVRQTGNRGIIRTDLLSTSINDKRIIADSTFFSKNIKFNGRNFINTKGNTIISAPNFEITRTGDILLGRRTLSVDSTVTTPTSKIFQTRNIPLNKGFISIEKLFKNAYLSTGNSKLLYNKVTNLKGININIPLNKKWGVSFGRSTPTPSGKGSYFYSGELTKSSIIKGFDFNLKNAGGIYNKEIFGQDNFIVTKTNSLGTIISKKVYTSSTNALSQVGKSIPITPQPSPDATIGVIGTVVTRQEIKRNSITTNKNILKPTNSNAIQTTDLKNELDKKIILDWITDQNNNSTNNLNNKTKGGFKPSNKGKVKSGQVQITNMDTVSITKPKSEFKTKPVIDIINPIIVPPFLSVGESTRIPPKMFKLNKNKIFNSNKSSKGLFNVSVRRRGIFKPIAKGVSLDKAFNIGRKKVSTSLSATFKITGRGLSGLRTPKGFRLKKDKKNGLLFIEQRRYRLSTFGEKSQIKLEKRGILTF